MNDYLRKCLTCGVEAIIEKDLENFANVPKGRTAKYGKLNRCKKCHNKYMREARNKIPKEILQYRRRKSMLKEKYNLSIEDYNTLFEAQNGCCSICGKHQDEDNKTFAVDHNHKTNEIRGLLCNNCNSALGKFSDDIKNIINAAFYLADNGNYGNKLNKEKEKNIYFKLGELKVLSS